MHETKRWKVGDMELTVCPDHPEDPMFTTIDTKGFKNMLHHREQHARCANCEQPLRLNQSQMPRESDGRMVHKSCPMAYATEKNMKSSEAGCGTPAQYCTNPTCPDHGAFGTFMQAKAPQMTDRSMKCPKCPHGWHGELLCNVLEATANEYETARCDCRVTEGVDDPFNMGQSVIIKRTGVPGVIMASRPLNGHRVYVVWTGGGDGQTYSPYLADEVRSIDEEPSDPRARAAEVFADEAKASEEKPHSAFEARLMAHKASMQGKHCGRCKVEWVPFPDLFTCLPGFKHHLWAPASTDEPTLSLLIIDLGHGQTLVKAERGNLHFAEFSVSLNTSIICDWSFEGIQAAINEAAAEAKPVPRIEPGSGGTVIVTTMHETVEIKASTLVELREMLGAEPSPDRPIFYEPKEGKWTQIGVESNGQRAESISLWRYTR